MTVETEVAALTTAVNSLTSSVNVSKATLDASVAAAEAAYDSFDDRYLGAKSSAPSTDNDGNSLLTGALYFNSTENAMYVYTGASWVITTNYNNVTAPYTLAQTLNTNGNDVTFGDNGKATFGAGDDLQIYHDGTRSYISDLGTGDLRLQTNELRMVNAANTEVGIKALEDGAVTLYYNGNSSIATTATGIDVTGTATMDGLVVEAGIAQLQLIDTGVDGSTKLRTANAQTWLEVDPDNVQASSGFATYIDGKKFLNIADSGDISFYEDTGTTAKLFWDASAEKLGIGTTSPAYVLDVTGATATIGKFKRSNVGTTEVLIDTSGSGDAKLVFADNGTDSYAIGRDNSNGDLVIAASGELGTSNLINIESGGNVGIGTSSPSSILSISGTDTTAYSSSSVGGQDSSATLKIQNLTTSADTFASIDFNTNNNRVVNRIVSSHGSSTVNGFLAFVTEGSGTPAERMRIDSAGNLLVGGTSPYAVDATTITQTGLVYSSRTSNLSGQFDRRTTNGEIMRFTKDGAPVGSIGTGGGDIVVASRSNKGFKIYAPNADGTGAILHPSTDAAGNPLNAKMDLGYSSGRFKDLYLSGGVYLGGTAAANKLDEYEEGIWIPTLTTSNGGTLGLQYAKGRYTKVGNLVHVSVNIRRDATALSGTDGFLQISTPFTSASSESSHRAGASCVYQTVTLNGILVARMQANTAYFNLQKETNGVLSTSITAADLSNGAPASSSGYVQVAFSYLSV